MTQTEANQLKADIGILIDSYVDGAPPPDPIITLFVYDASGNLTWETANGQNASLNGGEFNNQQVDLQDSIPVIVLVDTTFWLTVTGAEGTEPATASVTVTATTLPDVEYIGPGLVEYEEKHIHQGKRVEFRPGTEYRRIDVPPSSPSHANGGIMNEGELIALRGPSDAPIIFSSQNPLGHRGHVMTTGPGISQARGVVVRDMGRTDNRPLDADNLIGFYPWHFHLCGDSPASFIEDSLIYDTVLPAMPRSKFRHGLVIHGTNGLRVARNIVRNKCGSGIYLEDGTEVDNWFDGNLIEDIYDYNLNGWQSWPVRPVSAEPQMTGNGFYIRHPQNRFTSNIVRRVQRGYLLFPRANSLPTTPRVYLSEFAGNKAQFCQVGLEPWEVGGEDGDTVYKDFIAEDCECGFYPYPGWRVVLDSPTFRRCTYGMAYVDYPQRGFKVLNPTATECVVGLYAPMGGGPLEWSVEGGFFRCRDNIVIAMQFTSGEFTYGPRKTVIRGVRHEAMPGKPLQAVLVQGAWDWQNRTNVNVWEHEQVEVIDHNGVAGDNFRVYADEQRGNYVLPSGLTNAESLAQLGKCFYGEIAPAGASALDGIVGLIAPF